MLETKMTSDLLSAIAGVLLSLAFSYIPGINEQFAKLSSSSKRLIMGGLLLLVAGATFGLSCANILSSVTCDKPGAIGLVSNFVMAMIANQSTYSISPETESVRNAKAFRL